MFILNLNVNIPCNISCSRNFSVFPVYSLLILKLQTVTQFVWAPCQSMPFDPKRTEVAGGIPSLLPTFKGFTVSE